MPGSPGYAWEKFFQAVDLLLTGNGPLKTRLVGAGIYLVTLDPDDLPTPDLAENFQRIMFSLVKREAKGDEGTLRATVEKMDNRSATELAHEILEAYIALAPYAEGD